MFKKGQKVICVKADECFLPGQPIIVLRVVGGLFLGRSLYREERWLYIARFEPLIEFEPDQEVICVDAHGGLNIGDCVIVKEMSLNPTLFIGKRSGAEFFEWCTRSKFEAKEIQGNVIKSDPTESQAVDLYAKLINFGFPRHGLMTKVITELQISDGWR